ncbi:Elongation factor 3-like protein [Rozella allomycis CSF55]|uniref:Elongation factor 3 n=1 Tax=Rozella allomycis (strain CSF55) TaxID=988480 RepID=A0A075AMU6_ROZAC|nr:Elongation factor 3-like protein [Rozella allomycis CSF55]|eukprot:EPZ31034.1 Elongation factor 3-like protein [Rozella allomycis CSF55]
MSKTTEPSATVSAQSKRFSELLVSLKTAENIEQVISEMVSVTDAIGLANLQKEVSVVSAISEAAVDKTSVTVRQGACAFVEAVANKKGRVSCPYVLPMLGAVLDAYSDKQSVVQEAAKKACEAVLKHVEGVDVQFMLPILFEAMSNSKKWQGKEKALNILGSFVSIGPKEVAQHLPEIITHLTENMWSTKTQVQTAAFAAIKEIFKTVENGDIEQFMNDIISCIAKPEEVPETIYKLSSTTFIRPVDQPTLAVMVPLLERGLKERATVVLRQTSIIIGNMCKLVTNPEDAQHFLPKLMPGLNAIIENASNPELREVATKAKNVLIEVGAEGNEFVRDEAAIEKEIESLTGFIKSGLKGAKNGNVEDLCINFVCNLASTFIGLKNFEEAEWVKSIGPFVKLLTEENEKVTKEFLKKSVDLDISRKMENMKVEEDIGGVDLCNCEFSLAYGGMILLNNTKLRMKRGRRYGLLGHNGCGKSTLMRAIANGQLEGFPSKDELRSVYVAHELQASDSDMTVVEYILEDEFMKGSTAKEVEEFLLSMNFTHEICHKGVGSLSGGWKMKTQLARAMLLKADILLLDEPTNHLDVKNVAWLENYLNGLDDVTCMIVSHESKFLNTVCTDIIHYESRKLKIYHGNLTHFVSVKPEAKAYFELSASQIKFKFPEPGFLDGVKSRDKAILKMMKCAYKYPNAEKNTISNITVQCSLASRIAVIGPNGAGKSTIIKLLTGETIPTEGEVWKHPNLRFAYVAQHAFHHLEQHLDMTPNEYIQWRFQYGEDKELLSKATRKMTPEEEAELKKEVKYEGTKRVIDALLGRRKLKNSYEYEVKWVNMPMEENAWITREKLDTWGFQKLVQAFDDAEAARQGLYAKPLTQKNIEKHLIDFGLDPEFATHSRIRGLSGGQKVKVVIGAAMWMNPHIVVLDEPTNYLDRDSLGALAHAINEFQGGVIMISHNSEFTSSLCPTTWNVDKGVLSIDGVTDAGKGEKIEQKEQEETIDAFGNVTKVKSTKKLSRKELKAKEKAKKLKKKQGIAVSDSEDDDFDI